MLVIGSQELSIYLKVKEEVYEKGKGQSCHQECV